MTEPNEWEPIPGEVDAFQRFDCSAPPSGISFQVLEDKWEERDGVWYRTIRKVKIVGPAGWEMVDD